MTKPKTAAFTGTRATPDNMFDKLGNSTIEEDEQYLQDAGELKESGD